MINRAEMIRQIEIESKLQVTPKDEVEKIIVERIRHICKGIKKRVRIGRPADSHGEHGIQLFSISAEDYSLLRSNYWNQEALGRVKTDDLQAIGLQVMKRYGLKENFFPRVLQQVF